MPKLQQLVSYIQGLHLIAQALSEPGLKKLLHHIDALEGVIYSLVHLIALVLPAQCWVNLGLGWQCQGVGHWAAVTVIFTGGAFSHLRDCSLNCTQVSTFICSNSR